LERWDEAEFRAVFLHYYARIIGILVRLLGDRSRAEELASDAFWRLYQQPALQDGNVSGWLYRTATHLGIDALRASGRRRRYEEAAGRIRNAGTSAGPLDDLLRQEECRRVRAVLASIKPSSAQLLILRTYGFSYKELAAALNVRMSGIGTMLNRAEEEFRERYSALHLKQEEI
jgi:RNA polymerase sigma-70 factor (ECF subfamily)